MDGGSIGIVDAIANDGGSDIINPVGIDSEPVEPSKRKYSKRNGSGGNSKPGSGGSGGGSTKTGQKSQVDLSSLTGMFVGLHAVFAMQTNTPEMMISDDEGKSFIKAAQNVLRHYSVETTQKTLDWIALLGATAGIYAPRFVAISARKKSVKKETVQSNQPLNIYPDGI